jgi:hypothetical protein
MSQASPVPPALLQRFTELVRERGADVISELVERFEEQVPIGREHVLSRQLHLTPYLTHLREYSEAAMEHLAYCIEHGLQFNLIARCNPKARAAGDRMNLRCYPGEGWVIKVKHAAEEAAIAATAPDATQKRSSEGGLRSAGRRG